MTAVGVSGSSDLSDEDSELFDLHDAVVEGSLGDVRKFLAKEININELDDEGYAPLHLAAVRGNLEIMKVLIKHGAKTDLCSDGGYTALHLAAGFGHSKVVKYLIAECKFDVNIRDADGSTALQRAVFCTDDARMATIKCLVEEHKADVHACQEDGSTALHLAASIGHLDAVKYFVENCKADVSAATKDGVTLFDCAAAACVKYSASKQSAEVLAYVSLKCMKLEDALAQWNEFLKAHPNLPSLKFLIRFSGIDDGFVKADSVKVSQSKDAFLCAKPCRGESELVESKETELIGRVRFSPV